MLVAMSSRNQREGPSMQRAAVESFVEHTSIGRVVIPPKVPPGFRLFYTTIDFDGCIDDRIRRVVNDVTLVTCRQVHGATVHYAEPEPGSHDEEPECDALWTDTRHVALAIKVADCLPVSIIDPKNFVIANIHSGWRSAAQNITATTLGAMKFDPAAAFAFLGPSIRVCCFEVGEEVAAQFDPRFVDRTLGAKPHVDIPAMTIEILRDRGFADIVDTELCTKCGNEVSGFRGLAVSEVDTARLRNLATSEPLFHSYRRDKRSGRNLAIVAQ